MVHICSPSSSHSSSSGRHNPSQQSVGSGFHTPVLSPPPPPENAPPVEHSHLHPRSPPPATHGHEFALPPSGEHALSALPVHGEVADPRSFITLGHHRPLPPSHGHGHPQQYFGSSTPPPSPSFHHHHHPPPPSHGHGRGHGPPRQPRSRPASHEPLLPLPALALGTAAPHVFMSRNHSPLPRPPPPPSPYFPHSHGHGHQQYGGPLAPEIEAPHLFAGHSISPPPPPDGHVCGHDSPHFHGFRRISAAQGRAKEAVHQNEHHTSGLGLYPFHHSRGHVESINSWGPITQEQHPPPRHRMGGDHDDHLDGQGHSRVPHEMAGGSHCRGDPDSSPPHCTTPEFGWRQRAPPSYPPFCAPLPRAAHLRNAHVPHLAVPVC